MIPFRRQFIVSVHKEMECLSTENWSVMHKKKKNKNKNNWSDK